MENLLLAAEVLHHSDREHPADSVLRTKLKSAGRLSRTDSAEVSRLVFEYYRWKGWLTDADPLRIQVERSRELADRFARDSGSFPDADLLQRAVPAWVSEVLNLNPAFVRALQTPPAVWLRAKAGQGTEVARVLGDCTLLGQGLLGDLLQYRGAADLFRTSAFQSGQFELQDISSAAVGFVCAPAPGETWWDACAGEGGKTLHLSDLMQNRGLIWASDRAEWRLRKLRLRAARARVFNYRSTAWDGGERLPTRTLFDGVLVDAPCSGIGTWQRNPHARWTTTRHDVSELAEIQKRLLSHASRAVKPGGKLIYASCTVSREETLDIAEFFQATQPLFQPLPFHHPLALSKPAVSTLQIWPQDFGGNGLFIAAWQRSV